MMDFRENFEAFLNAFVVYLMVASFLSSLVFVIQYQVRTGGDWRKTQTGRNIMIVMIAVTMVLFSVCMSKIVGAYSLQVYVQMIAYGTLFVVVTQRNFIFDLLQRKARREELAGRLPKQ